MATPYLVSEFLNRVTGIKYLNHDNRGLQIDIGYLPREVNGTGTTNFIGEWRYRQFAGQPSTDRRVDTFEYDVNGNVTSYKIKIENNSYDVRYEYDSANRLVRENNQHLNKTYTYAYDSNGNITAKKEYAYTTAALDAPAQNNYYDADRLTSWDGESFAYDKGGNPTLYKGEQMTWMRGRLLKSYTKGGKKYEFNYDASGERFVKKIGTQSTYYETINGKLIFEERADGTNITFLYGSDGIIGFAVGGKIYFYAKNVFGDVVALYDYTSGDPVARYGFANSTINFWTGFAGGKSGVFNEFLIKQGGLMYGSAIAAFLAPIPKTVGYTMIAGCSKRLGSQLTRMIFGSGVGSLFRGLFNAIFN